MLMQPVTARTFFYIKETEIGLDREAETEADKEMQW
jgi:hypothetical protein